MDSGQISRHPQSLALPCRRALRGRSQLRSCQEDAPTRIYLVIDRLVEAGARAGLQQCSVSAAEPPSTCWTSDLDRMHRSCDAGDSMNICRSYGRW